MHQDMTPVLFCRNDDYDHSGPTPLGIAITPASAVNLADTCKGYQP